nr:pentapeptide repeat-containing protein [uncultured Flavobacterium sp.]
MKNNKDRWLIHFEKNDVTMADFLSESKNFSDSPFGVYYGKIDLRGIVSNKYDLDIYKPSDNIKDITVLNANFSESAFSTIHFFNCHFIDCNFDGSKFENDTRFWDNCTFKSCTFTKSSFSNCGFNSLAFMNCTFAETKWQRQNTFSQCLFEHCVLNGTLKNLNFSDAQFNHTKFIGILQNITFLGWNNIPATYEKNGNYAKIPYAKVHNQMNHVNFEEATIQLCTFTQFCYLHKIIPPQSSDNLAFHITTAFHKTALELAKKEWQYEKEELEIADWFINTFYKPDNRLPDTIIHKSDYAKRHGEIFSNRLFKTIQLAVLQTQSKI